MWESEDIGGESWGNVGKERKNFILVLHIAAFFEKT